MDDISECYRILDLEPGASLEDVERSYRELVKVWHPDRFRRDPKLRAKAEEKLSRINLATNGCARKLLPLRDAGQRPRKHRSRTQSEAVQKRAPHTVARKITRRLTHTESTRRVRRLTAIKRDILLV